MLKKLIRESFFNPILHFIALFVFLVAEQTAGIGRAWVLSLPVMFLVGGYIFYFYQSILLWHVSTVSFFFLAALSSTVSTRLLPDSIVQPLYTEISLLTLLIVFYFLKGKLQRWITTLTSKKLSMMNNFSEMIRFSVILIIITSVYIVLYLLLSLQWNEKQAQSLRFMQQLYHFALIMTGVYQTVRVFAIRHQLMKEEWWPIVNQSGKEIGSIHYQNSLWIERQKFIHPVVRIVVMESNRILLHQNTFENERHVRQWDTAIGAHVKFGETIEDCIRRTGEEFYGASRLNPVFLTNYQIENSCEYQYVHLFVSGRFQVERINPQYSQHLKWWTLNQICEELNSGIFTGNFKKEFELLLHIGLIDSGNCTCECNLRDTVHQKKSLA